MPKLLQINSAINLSSPGRIAEHIGILAINNGWDCYIAHGKRYENTTKLKDISTSKLLNEKIHFLGTLITDGAGLFSRNDTKLLINTIKEISPDIIHIHNIHGHYINYKLLFEFIIKSNIHVVITMHDCWIFTGHCVYFDAIGCEKWKKLCNKCPLSNTYPKSFIDNSSKNFKLKKKLLTQINSLTLVPVSNWLARLTAESFLKNKNIQVIHNGIDINVFKPTNSNLKEKLNIKNDRFVVLGVANHFGARKGFDDFIQISKILPQVQVILVGTSEEEQKKVPNNIITFKRTNNVLELVQLYSLADVFVNPTYEDNFPTTNLEALSCGTPVITYNTGGSPESIDYDTGIVVNKGDINELAFAIETIKSKGKDFYTKTCRDRAVKCFNKEERFEDYLKLYKQILEKDLK